MSAFAAPAARTAASVPTTGPIGPMGTPGEDPEYPRLSPSCSFHLYDGGGDGSVGQEYVLGVGGRHFRVSALARRILERLDGKTSLAEIAARLQGESVAITADELRTVLEQRYSRLGVLAPAAVPATPMMPGAMSGAVTAVPADLPRGARPAGFPFLLTWDLVPQPVVEWFARGLRGLYSWPGAALLLLSALAHLPVYSRPLAPRAGLTLSAEQCLAIMGLSVLSILIHELGHAAAVSRFGGTPGRIGFGLYLLMPTFYADVSQIWRFPRRHRMLVDLGGVYFQQLCFAVFAAAGVATGRTELFAACRMIDFMALMTLNPIFRFDGYWFLVDYLAIPRLQALALSYPGYLWSRLRGRPVEAPRLPALGRVGRVVFRSYAALSGLFLIAVVGLAINSLSSAFAWLPRILPALLESTRAAFVHADPLALLYRTLVLFLLLAFPASALIGLVLYLLGAGRWCAGKLCALYRRQVEILPRRET